MKKTGRPNQGVRTSFKKLLINLSPETKYQLDEHATQLKKTQTQICREALALYFEKFKSA
jgi:predicted transcriptional regulator